MLLIALAACAPDASPNDTGVIVVAPGEPLASLDAAWRARFDAGEATFNATFSDADGLGPAYIQPSCGGCHDAAGAVQTMVYVEDDGFTPQLDQSALAWGHTVRPLVAGGAVTPLLPPEDAIGLAISARAPPPLLGRGYVEAVLDREIERLAAEQALRTDGISGRPNRVAFGSVASADEAFHDLRAGDPIVGRFGAKARIGTCDDFAADAFVGDMSLTSPLRPAEHANPDGLTDDHRVGVDLDAESIARVADYVRLLAIPTRAEEPEGEALFVSIGCATCHEPALRTRDDYPIVALAGIDAPLYSDLLLHDLGAALAGGMTEGEGSVREWRTAPLIGVRFQRSFLHDGRARSVPEAIVAHGAADGEGADVTAAFLSLDADDQGAIVRFVRSR